MITLDLTLTRTARDGCHNEQNPNLCEWCGGACMVGGYSALSKSACLSEAADRLNKYMSPAALSSNYMQPTSAPAPRKGRRRTNGGTKRSRLK